MFDNPQSLVNLVYFVPQYTILTEARLAQSVEHETLNLRVVGSSPTLGDKFFPIMP